MDSRDSSSSSMSASRDGSSVDDDGVLSVTSGLAKEAAFLFQSQKFVECVDVLNQLLQKKEDDPKILHNIAIAEYFRDGCSDPKKLLEVLDNVKRRSEKLALASGEHVEAVNNLANRVVSASKGTNTMSHHFSAASSASIVFADEFDTSVASLNIAVIWFHLHEYAKSLSVLEPLYQNIVRIDETTALHICLLLLDIALALGDASKSADVINYLERTFNGGGVINQAENTNTVHQSSNLLPKSSSLPTQTDVSNSDSPATINAAENSLSRTLSDDQIEDLSTVISSLLSEDRSIPTIDLKLKLQLYKVRFLLLTRNLKAAKREVKEAMNIARGRDSSMALLLKSQLEYARGNHRKAVKLLMASNTRTEAVISSVLNNNIGCIHYQLGKHHTSSLFFTKALSNSSSLRKDKPKKLLTFSQDKSLLIIYNCGMQYLACGKPVLAARCFEKSSLVLYHRPLLWLRIAECCLMAFEKGLLNGSDIRLHVIGKGKWRQLVVEDGLVRNGYLNGKDDLFWSDDKQPKLSMSLARMCLFNALHLLNSLDFESGLPSTLEENRLTESASSKKLLSSSQVHSNGDVKDAKEQKTSLNEVLQSSISEYQETRRKENRIMKQAVLADLAYVELELENPLKALSVAKSLLELPECSRIYIFLGRIFSAEALCLLNRPKEASEHLSFYFSGESGLELPFREEDRVEKGVDSDDSLAINNNSLEPEVARGMLYVNLAAMAAMQGMLEQAHQFVTQALSVSPNCREAILTAVYVDLRLGKTQEALGKLKQCSHVRFLLPSIGLTLNESSC